MLIDRVIGMDYASEIMARQIRKRPGGEKIGIFLCCECEAKLALAKHPYGDDSFETDHAMAVMELFPRIRQNMSSAVEPVCFCKEGLQSCNTYMMPKSPEYLIADGFDKINDILSMEEFDMLEAFELLQLYPCFNGCIGGHLLWGNSYLVKHNIEALTKDGTRPPMELPVEELEGTVISEKSDDFHSLKEKLSFFSQVNEILERLPGFDCSACGVRTCRIMAEEIAKGNKHLEDCRVLLAVKKGSAK